MPPNFPLSSNAGFFTSQNAAQRIRSPKAYPVTLSSSSTLIIPENLGRLGILFANPGFNTVFICPEFDSDGNPLPAGPASAGSIPLSPGQWMILSSGIGCGWNGAAVTGSGNPFTVLEFLG